RYQLRGALRSENSARNIFNGLIENISHLFTTPIRFAAVSVVVLFIGVLLGGLIFKTSTEAPKDLTENTDQFTMFNNDIRISNISFIDSDPSDGEVEFTFEASKPVRLRGKINDQKIQSVLTYAMLNEQNPGSRLNSINAMDSESPVQLDPDVKNALIKVLMTDNNPGVRREALKLMKKFPYDESFKEALLYVVTTDTSTGLRIEALNSLIEAGKQGYKLNKDEINLFKQQLQQDENNYIKLKSRTILQEYN
ncbi:MAG TPA: HEAT repeat domain-containing protein, partial [Ignavibacteriaceae bacterium]